MGKNGYLFDRSMNAERQRNYFSFYDYDYCLDISKQKKLMSTTESVEEGLREALEWYLGHSDAVNKKPYIAYIDNNLACIK